MDGRSGTLTRLPPGPPRSVRTLLVYGPARNPLGFFQNLARSYGDLSYVRTAGEHLVLVNDARYVRDILVTHQHKFMKGRGLERAKRLLGEGLLTSEGAVHVRQRRLMQPAFHRDRIATYASVMTSYAQRVRDSWSDGSTIDAAREMNRLTLGVVGKTLFDADVESQAREVGDALTDVMESFWLLMLPLVDVLERLPIPALRRSRAARTRLDAIIYGMIAERRRAPADRGDLLSMLLMAQDEEEPGPSTSLRAGPSTSLRAGPSTSLRAGRGMTDEQVRDEAMTIFLAGHETTANALAWTWYLLSQSPDAERKLHEEVDRVLRGRTPTVADLPSLTYVEQVLTEAMRLYPPAWIIGRRALEDYAIDEYLIPARSILVASPYLIQRDRRHYDQPEAFIPERWTPEYKAALPPFAYFPFGGGARRCIGESFAWMELMLVVSALAQRWRLELVPGHPVVPQPVVTLRMKHGLKMIVRSRPFIH
jgi:cytochrome P450